MPTKIILPLVLIVAAAAWLASTNLSQANYFYSVNELPDFSDPVFNSGLKIKGRIIAGSIEKDAQPVKFSIEEGGKSLAVRYVGDEPLPDMFKDHAEAVVEGTMAADGVFNAVHLQAKCASKYEAAAPEVAAGMPAETTAPYSTTEPPAASVASAE